MVGNSLTGGSVGSFGISDNKITGGKNIQNMSLITTASREVAQTLTSTSVGWVWTGSHRLYHWCYRVRTQPKCHEDNLKKLA